QHQHHVGEDEDEVQAPEPADAAEHDRRGEPRQPLTREPVLDAAAGGPAGRCGGPPGGTLRLVGVSRSAGAAAAGPPPGPPPRGGSTGSASAFTSAGTAYSRPSVTACAWAAR